MRASPPLPSLLGVRVLIVDDDADYRDTLQVVLEIQSANVRTAGSIQGALELVASFEPEILICDFFFPLQSGCRLIRQLRQEGRNTPAIAVTAYTNPEVKRMCLDAGFQEVLWKPVEPWILVKHIASLTRAGAEVRVPRGRALRDANISFSSFGPRRDR